METIYIANISRRCVEAVVFDQVKVFAKLSATLALECYDEKKSTCSKVLRDLIKIQETEDLLYLCTVSNHKFIARSVVPPVTLKLLDAIKTAAFVGSKPGNIFDKDSLINASVGKEEMFPPMLVKKWNQMVENMRKSIKSHQQVVTELQVVQEKYWLAKHYMGAGENLNVVQKKRETILSKKKKSQSKLQKTIDNFKDNQVQYWSLKYWQLIAEENKLRQKLKQAEGDLREDIEKRLEFEIQKGLTNPMKICHTKQISEIDCSKVAHDIFDFTSNVYAIKLPPSSRYFSKPTPPPKMFIPCVEKSEFALVYGTGDRSARRRNLGSSENIYVTCVRTTKTGAIGHLNINEGQMIKQKLVSADGKLGFGWCRNRKFSPKHWGFYPTSSVSGAPKGDENDGACQD